MKNRVYKAVAALCAVFLVVACFVPMMGVKAAAAGYWTVKIYNTATSGTYGEVSIPLVESAESIIVGGAEVVNGWLRNKLIFTYKNSSGSYESYEWTYPGTDDLLGFKVKLGSTWYEYGIGEAFRGEGIYTAKVDAVYLITGESKEEERHKTLLEKLADLPDTLLSGLKTALYFISNPLDAVKALVLTIDEKLSLLPDNISKAFANYMDSIESFLQFEWAKKLNPSGALTWLESSLDYLANSIKLAIFGDDSADDDLVAGSGGVSGGLGDVQDFENGYLGSIQDGMGDLSADVDVNFLASTFAFIGGRVGSVYDGLGDYSVVFLLPVFIGLFFMLARFNPRSLEVRDRPAERRDK